MWILKTRECHKLSRSTIENILEDVTLLFHSVHEEMYDYNMMKKLSQSSVQCTFSQQHLQCVSDIFEQSKVIFSSFKGLETAYLQQKYFRNSFNMIVSFFISCCYYLKNIIQDPISITLGSATQWKWRSPKRRCVSVEEKMVYIPLLLILKQLTNLAKAEVSL